MKVNNLFHRRLRQRQLTFLSTLVDLSNLNYAHLNKFKNHSDLVNIECNHSTNNFWEKKGVYITILKIVHLDFRVAKFSFRLNLKRDGLFKFSQNEKSKKKNAIHDF